MKKSKGINESIQVLANIKEKKRIKKRKKGNVRLLSITQKERPAVNKAEPPQY